MGLAKTELVKELTMAETTSISTKLEIHVKIILSIVVFPL